MLFCPVLTIGLPPISYLTSLEQGYTSLFSYENMNVSQFLVPFIVHFLTFDQSYRARICIQSTNNSAGKL